MDIKITEQNGGYTAIFEGRLDTVEEKVAKLDETPADEPADSEVELEENTPKSKMSYLRKK